MTEIDEQIERLQKRLQQKKEEKRRKEAKTRAREQRELDRRNLLLGRTIAEAFNAPQFEKLRGHIGSRKCELTTLSEEDYQQLMTYLGSLMASRS